MCNIGRSRGALRNIDAQIAEWQSINANAKVKKRLTGFSDKTKRTSQRVGQDFSVLHV